MSLANLLRQHQFKSVLPDELQHGPAIELDMSGGDPHWLTLDIHSAEELDAYAQQLKKQHGAVIAIGRYLEDRAFLYSRSDLFLNKDELRSVHLGIDLMVPAGTPVMAPLAGIIHSFADNQGEGDYGPTIILQHELAGVRFFTLYGHLCAADACACPCPQPEKGRRVEAGEQIACVGDSAINGGWPTHLHFQIITDMLGYEGDFPGVAAPVDVEKYKILCPDPNLVLQRGQTSTFNSRRNML